MLLSRNFVAFMHRQYLYKMLQNINGEKTKISDKDRYKKYSNSSAAHSASSREGP